MGYAELSCLHVCLLSSEIKDLVPHVSVYLELKHHFTF